MLAKRIFDVFSSLILIVILSPILIIISIVIICSGHPLLYKSKRVGLKGKEFYCLKFTSMKKLSSFPIEKQNLILREINNNGYMRNDPRVTFIGHWIRKTSIDELPQLFNVLFNDMSLVGPRPISHYEIEKYGKYFKHYKMSKPGITGLWQISGRDNIGYKQRVAMDVLYSRNKCFLLDIYILLKTPLVVLKMDGVN
ncbi:TPA: sugar transferase [Klebsiella pneumoniae]|uniref:sugar transferase n=1 Tax=Klebsiella pneumoniae TaxID=573 RepID=UPI00141A1AC0|nr:sugar transferase [Klebsiella pneumoniae]HDT4206864.1 sugar transferase [Klebsiella pneumoniae subsp. pneumoniae]MCJ6019712.1 sugar transferase [Klebsiella pneumoniae]MEE2243565.1 sugar transferase [Klebsiella pneumoniae]NIA83368.1 sugar transferase [Klebsiella pneumoniae]CAE7679032.1 Undecaprenyl phosphate N%2CN'-diacetylbacillosamine 1-phosphate transferase [Klebsiella pneumoniae]